MKIHKANDLINKEIKNRQVEKNINRRNEFKISE